MNLEATNTLVTQFYIVKARSSDFVSLCTQCFCCIVNPSECRISNSESTTTSQAQLKQDNAEKHSVPKSKIIYEYQVSGLSHKLIAIRIVFFASTQISTRTSDKKNQQEDVPQTFKIIWVAEIRFCLIFIGGLNRELVNFEGDSGQPFSDTQGLFKAFDLEF